MKNAITPEIPKTGLSSLYWYQHALGLAQTGIFFFSLTRMSSLPPKIIFPTGTGIGLLVDFFLRCKYTGCGFCCCKDSIWDFKYTKASLGIWGMLLPLHISTPPYSRTALSAALATLACPVAKGLGYTYGYIGLLALGYLSSAAVNIPAIVPLLSALYIAHDAWRNYNTAKNPSTENQPNAANQTNKNEDDMGFLRIPYSAGHNVLLYTEQALTAIRDYCCCKSGYHKPKTEVTVDKQR